ncbi:MAG: bifunctional glycosyltransferase/CDP-glycerol:glycerophosphate glycerophosphotransferase [Streptomyces sp.]|uniref:bifunctional glycosyltransferase/CDP-glycerol:glycerophosphate glycerophosphotransferase n=1 Tax=Streptomyces sp. TaxID=1931 RepID=UPI003D6A915A
MVFMQRERGGPGYHPGTRTPRLSLVVPAYKVQGYVGECLDSVLGQDFTDFEVICVDDCSPDGSGGVLDRYAARDPRVRVVHLEENAGLGGARNAGVARAVGDYLLFLDSDDTLTPGALAAVARRLDATGDPDVLIYDYARTYWDGRVQRNLLHGMLEETAPSAFALDERPRLLDLLQVVWNKAYRREYIQRHGFAFPAGYYEDAPWTFCSLITAERIAVLDRVCVYYRQRREGGNILRTVSRRHFDVFSQYERIFTYLDDHPAVEKWRPAMFRKMVDQYLTIIDNPGRLPKNSRREFFAHASHDYRLRRPAGFVRPAAGRGYKYALLGLGSYVALAGAKTVGKVRRSVRRYGRRQVLRAKRSAMSIYYAAHLRLPVDENLAVFSAYWSRSYACNPAAIDAELTRRAPHVRRVWAVRADEARRMPDGVDVVLLGSHAYWAAVARAKYLVNNVNFPDAVVKRKGSVHLQTHHGTPLKTMGLDQRNFPASHRGTDFAALLARCDRWDYSVSANGFSTAVWGRVYPCAYTHLETGYPRNDVLLNATAEDVRQARRSLGLADGTTALLYAPTHREHEVEFTPRLDLEQLMEGLDPDTVILVRGHYFYEPPSATSRLRTGGRIVDVSAHPGMEQLYLAADGLITDYSSSMFDYANLDRPIVIYADDWDIYRAVRGTYFDLLNEAPGPVATTQQQLSDILRTGAWRDDAAAEARAVFRARFCEYDDGRAAERVVRRVFLGEDAASLPPITPLAERTPAPSPSQVLESPALEPLERV